VVHGLYDARPTVTFPAVERHRSLAGTILCCLVNRGTCVWTTCRGLLLGSRPAGNRTCDRMQQPTTDPPRHPRGQGRTGNESG